MKAKSVAIVICTEPGTLECMSQLLVKSIRQFGGALKDADIFSVQPRNPEPLSQATRDVFRQYGVAHEYALLNTKYTAYGFANKVAACDYFAEKLSHDYLLFLDSDHLVLNDLRDILAEGTEASMRVVNKKGVGSTGNDENAPYWKKLYDLFGVKSRQFVKSVIEEEEILRYYNAGLIFGLRESGLFQQWRVNFERVMDEGIRPQQGLFFVEQSVLSATIAGMSLRVHELPDTYNYSPETHIHRNSMGTALGLDKICTFHYHRLFNPPRKVNIARDFSPFKGPKLDWIKQELINCGVNANPFYEDWEVDLLRQKRKIIEMMKPENR